MHTAVVGNIDDLLVASLTKDLERLWMLTSCRSQDALRVMETLDVIEVAANNEDTPAWTPLMVVIAACTTGPKTVCPTRAVTFD